MKSLSELSDDEIDDLLLQLFNGQARHQGQAPSVRDFSQEDLLRIRSKNHPDKWPNVNLEAYQAAVEELDRRRLARPR